jgi:hypothetical protein
MLPHPETLAKWYRNIRGDASFSDEAFNMLDIKVKAGDGEHLYCKIATLLSMK